MTNMPGISTRMNRIHLSEHAPTMRRLTSRPCLSAATAMLALALATTLARAQQAAPPAAQDPYKRETEPAQAMAHPKPQVSLLEVTFSLPIADAFALLHESPDDAERYRRLAAMTTQGTAIVERLIGLRTNSGERAVSESIDEWRYPFEYRAIGPGAVMVAEFETRNVGDVLECEPAIGPDHTIDLDFWTSHGSHSRERSTTGSDLSLQPLFKQQRLGASVAMKDGHPFLLGTLSPPLGYGIVAEQPEHRIWLDFMTCSILPVEPEEPASPPTPASPALKR
jgi:hypothetical protein